MHPLRLSCLALFFSLAATPAAAQEITLKVNHFLPGMALAQRAVLEPWCTELNRDSGGRIKCQFFPSMQLGGIPSQLPDYKVLAMHGDGGMTIHTATNEVRSADDLKDLKLRAPNRTIARTLTALGATPVAMPPAQMTEAIAKGVVDGASAVWEVIVPTKLDEVTRFHLETPADQPAMGATVLTVLMNKQRYAALPPDLREIIDRHSGLALVERFGQAGDGAISTARDKVKAAGHTVTLIEGNAYDEMRERAMTVEQESGAEAKTKGFDGAALVAAARAPGAAAKP